jgi:YggT family protein
MFVYTNLVVFIAQLLQGALWLYFWIVIASAVMTWIEPNPYNPIVRTINALTEPVFDWVRRQIPVFFGGLDFSPLVVLVAIEFLQQYLVPTLERVLISGFA